MRSFSIKIMDILTQGFISYYLLKKYGKNTFKNIYLGKDNIEKYLFNGFEKEAISNLISDS